MKESNGGRLYRIRSFWHDLRCICGMEQGTETCSKGDIEAVEVSIEMLSKKERALAGAFTPEQRRKYDSAQRNSEIAIEQIRADGERRAEEIVQRNCKEAINKMLFVAG